MTNKICVTLFAIGILSNLSGCDTTFEVESGKYAELLVEHPEIVDVRVDQDVRHGILTIDRARRYVGYQSDSGFYGQDYATLSYATRSCWWFLVWNCSTTWSGPINVTLNVGPGDAGIKDVLNADKIQRIGTILSDELINDPAAANTMVREFNAATVENNMKWGEILDPDGNYDFTIADRLINWATSNGISVKGHALIWYAQAPAFINQDIDANVLKNAIIDHIDVMLGHYDSDCVYGNVGLCVKLWDVVNEPSASASLIESPSPDDGRYRDNVFYQKLGPDYISLAFYEARKRAPNALLAINDYNVEGATHKSDNFYSIVKDLIDSGVPIDHVGFQSHVIFDHSPIALLLNLQRFSDLGLTVGISEMDVPAANLEIVTAELAGKILSGEDIEFFDLLSVPTIGRTKEDQNIYWANYAAACAMVSGCTEITQWGVNDGNSWISLGDSKPLTFDDSFNRKSTYFHLLSGATGNARLLEPTLRSESVWEAPFNLIIDSLTSDNL